MAPTLLYFDIIADNLPAYSSMDSPSFIRSDSNSLFNMCSLAFCTLSAPTNLVFNDSHTSFAVFFFATCIKISSGMAWKMNARAVLLFFSSTTTTVAGSMDSQSPWASSTASILIAQVM
ncbi:hypothetical protein Hdeb2414_s0004g00123461 [Helianthus debilis subsp. tardiflorus]